MYKHILKNSIITVLPSNTYVITPNDHISTANPLAVPINNSGDAYSRVPYW
jgi:hypothetical protein